ncbi:hypothetical protein BKA69DRAFT_1031867, partial [Paraphysoderma sedebokerense]
LQQVYHTYKRKTTFGLNPWIMIIWILSCVGGTAYAILQRLSIFITIQLVFLGIFCAICIAQHLYYAMNYSLLKSALWCIGIVVIYIGLITACYFAMVLSNSVILIDIFALSSPILVLVGFLPQYVTIYKSKTADGLSITFILMDGLGGIFFALSLAFRPGPYDVIAAVTGLSVTVCEFVNLGFCVYYRKRNRSEDVVDIETITKSAGSVGLGSDSGSGSGAENA